MLKKVRHMENSAFATPAFVFIVFGITELFGFSGLLSVIVFGLTLGNIGYFISSLASKHQVLYELLEPQALSKREKSIFSETVFLFQTFFFIYVGLSLNFTSGALIITGAVIVLFIFMARIASVSMSVPKDISTFNASIMAITAPRGLATAVLALIPLQRGLEGGQFVQELTWMVVFGSIVMTSLLVFLLYNVRGVRTIYARVLPEFTADNTCNDALPTTPSKAR
jgi:NhaP-type Na+/H+ or K+/H+ antiporter